MPLRSVTDHFAQQSRIVDLTVRGAQRAWRRMKGRNWGSAWVSDVGPAITEVVTAGQEAAAAAAQSYVTTILGDLGIDSSSPNRLNVEQFAGVSGSGDPLQTSMFGSVLRSIERQYEQDLADLTEQFRAEAALLAGEMWLDEMVTTTVADAARNAETVALAQRPWVTGWVRAIEPGACSRCAVLAGKFYLFNEGFLRHPACRCTHIPFAEDLPHDPTTNPNAYFDSLTKAEQDRLFTNAGAEAVRLGADIYQVVNARRGMSTAQQNPRNWIPKGRLEAVKMHGRDVFTTTAGVTKRGIYGKTRGNKPVRLMPESCLLLAGDDRAEQIRLLRLYGFILDD